MRVTRVANLLDDALAHREARLEDERRYDEDGGAERQHAQRDRLHPLENHRHQVAVAARDGARLVERRLDDVRHADEDEQRERQRFEDVREAVHVGVGAQVDGEDHQTPECER